MSHHSFLRIFISLFLVYSSILPSHAGLREAEKNYRKVYQASSADTFEESPFVDWYLRKDGKGGQALFSENLDFIGQGIHWQVIDSKGNFMALTGNAPEVIKTVLRKALRTDWMVTSDLNSGARSIVVLTAPNCPYCRLQEKDFKKYGKQLDIKVFIIPSLLGPDSKGFENAVLCGADPARIWKESMSRNVYPKSSTTCKSAEWAEIVRQHTGKPAPGGRINMSTPAVIKADGTVAYGWGENLSLDEIRQKLGLN